MGALAGFLRNAWHYFRKRHRKKRLSGCARVLEENKNIEQWKEKEPLLCGDYTEQRWKSVLDTSAAASPSQCCGNLDCSCSLVKKYTRALIDGNHELAERIRKGDFIQTPGGKEAAVTTRPMEKAAQGPGKALEGPRPTGKPKKSPGLKKPRPLAVCQPKKKSKTEKHRVIPPPDTSGTPKFISRGCCSKENCGCHVIKEYSRAVAAGDQETIARIKGDANPRSNDRQQKDEDTAKDDSGSGSKTDVIEPIGFGIEDTTRRLETPPDKHHNPGVDNSHESVHLPPVISSSSGESLNSLLNSASSHHSDTPEDGIAVLETGHIMMQDSSQHPKHCEVIDYTSNWHSTRLQDMPEPHPVTDSSFYHEAPSYYETNENVINSMVHARRVKKRNKAKPKGKRQTNVKSQLDPITRKRIIKVYETLIEDSSGSELPY